MSFKIHVAEAESNGIRDRKDRKGGQTGRYPYYVYPQIFEIVDFGNDTLEVAPAVTVGIFKG